MKKAASSKPKSALPKTVDEYLGRVPETALGQLMKLRAAIRSVVPKDAAEVISYGIPAFKTDRVLVWYGGFRGHCSLFPTAATIEAFKEDLKGYAVSKGTVHFDLEKPLPIALIKKLVKARVDQVAAARR